MKTPFLPTKATLFHIGGSDELGQFTKPITGRLPLNELRTEIAEIFDLVPIEEKQDINYVINPVDLLNSFTANMLKEIHLTQQNFFNQLVSKHEDGVFRSFEMDYERILDGELEDGNKLSNDLNEIFIYHKKIFLKTNAFIHNGNKMVSNITNISNEFGILVNVLLMNITVQFKRKGSKKYFNNNKLIPNDILDIKNHILDLLDNVFQPPNFPENKIFYSCQNLKNFLIWSILENQEYLKKYELVTGVEITKPRIKALLKSEMQETGCVTHTNYSTLTHHQISVTGDLCNHYSMLLDLLAYIKLIEKMHLALCKSNEVTGEFPAEYLFMLNPKK